MRRITFFILFLFFAHSAYADDSATNRDNSGLGFEVGYSPMSLPLPGTKFAGVYYNLNADWQLGFDYANTTLGLTAFSFEFGEVNEYSRGLKLRYFTGNSFNWIMGYGRRDTTFKLPSSLFNLVTHDYDEVATRTRTDYVQFGMGNQWLWENGFGLAIDWVTINFPIDGKVTTSADRYANDDADAREIRRLEDIVAWYPQFWMVAVKIGYTF